MKQFGKILKFEFNNYLKNKVFVGVTVFLVVVIAVVMFFPRIIKFFEEGPGGVDVTDPATDVPSDSLPTLLISVDTDEISLAVKEAFQSAFSDYNVVLSDLSEDEIKDKIVSGNAECAFIMSGLTSFTYYVNNLSMFDVNTEIATEVLQNLYRMNAMLQGGLSPEEATDILSVQIESDVRSLGVDQMQNFFYTYIMIFALYMVILLYGQMVATNVATEKSSRAMELLITSAKPTSMMFGKVIASCLAGLLQLIAIFGSALLFFNINKSYWGGNGIITSIFDMPVELFVYMLIFFILGFFIYAFMFGAVGSTASKLEDINTSVMPITLIFVAGFVFVMAALGSGTVDTTLMRVCSYIPFTSPMAMFTRIAMSTVPFYEILISIAILVCSVIGVGIASAKIYRVGVLLYGTTPKIKSIIKMIRKA